MEYDDAVDVTTTYLGQESIKDYRYLPPRAGFSNTPQLPHRRTICRRRNDRYSPRHRSI